MPTYRIKHVLPDGTVTGYHQDHLCNITQFAGQAQSFRSTPEQAEQTLAQARKAFENMWKNDDDDDFGVESLFPNWQCWRGHNLEQIRTVLEECP
jgi:hypothetical protein